MKLVRLNSEDLKRWRKQDWIHWDNGTIREMCGEKVIYRTLADAEKAKSDQESKWEIRLRIYNDCEHCVHYHLTSEV